MSPATHAERLATVGRLVEEEALPALVRYTALECLSPVFDPDWAVHGALAEAAAQLAAWCAGRPGVEASLEILELPGRTPTLVAEIAPNGGEDSTTLVYGHLDKQPALGPWREGLEPFRAVREGDRLYGRGTADDGYACFATFAALEAAAALGRPHGRILLLVEGSEESGSPDLRAYLDLLAPRLGTPDLAICLDSGCPTYDRLWTTTSLRGILVATLTVAVLTEGVHSGLAGGIVPSSFRIARALLSRIEEPTSGRILLEACNAPLPDETARALAEVAEEFGEAAAGTFPTLPGLRLSGAHAADRLANGTWHPALEVIGIAGAPEPANAGNVLRPETTLRVALRLPPTCDAAAAGAAVREALEADPPEGARVTATVDQVADGWAAPPTPEELARRLDEASRAYFGAPARSIGLGGSIPFMAELGRRFPGTPFVATGVLGPESNAHGPNEFLHLPTMTALTATLVDLLTKDG